MQLHKFLSLNLNSIIGLYYFFAFGAMDLENSKILDIFFPTKFSILFFLLITSIIQKIILILFIFFLIELFIYKKFKKQIPYPPLPKWVEIIHIIIFYAGILSLNLPLRFYFLGYL